MEVFSVKLSPNSCNTFVKDAAVNTIMAGSADHVAASLKSEHRATDPTIKFFDGNSENFLIVLPPTQ